MLERTCKQCGETKPFDIANWLSNYGKPYGTKCRACYNLQSKLRQQALRKTPEGLAASKKYRKDFYEKSRQNFVDLRSPPRKRGRPTKDSNQVCTPLIYSLTWPNSTARYVGKTVDLPKRITYHAKLHVNWRLHAAYAQLGLPTVTVLEYVENEADLKTRERFWITQLDSTNLDTGGLNIH